MNCSSFPSTQPHKNVFLYRLSRRFRPLDINPNKAPLHSISAKSDRRMRHGAGARKRHSTVFDRAAHKLQLRVKKEHSCLRGGTHRSSKHRPVAPFR